MIKIDKLLSTAGDGYWTRKKKQVHVTGFDLGYVNDERDFAELRVYFDTATWDTNVDGLVYTDSKFLKQLKAMLTKMGLDVRDVSYSEQGMQGSNYVSCDVCELFMNSLASQFPEEFVEMVC